MWARWVGFPSNERKLSLPLQQTLVRRTMVVDNPSPSSSYLRFW